MLLLAFGVIFLARAYFGYRAPFTCVPGALVANGVNRGRALGHLKVRLGHQSPLRVKLSNLDMVNMPNVVLEQESLGLIYIFGVGVLVAPPGGALARGLKKPFVLLFVSALVHRAHVCQRLVFSQRRVLGVHIFRQAQRVHR